MVKQFKGEVKISDVQAEFDALVQKANQMIDYYNNIRDSKEIKDYTVAGPDLAGKGYCLTVGGIKQMMKALDGMVIGGRAYFNTENKVRMSDGLLITKNEVFRLPSKTITRPANGNQIYYNATDNDYEWVRKQIVGYQEEIEEGTTNLPEENGYYKNNKDFYLQEIYATSTLPGGLRFYGVDEGSEHEDKSHYPQLNNKIGDDWPDKTTMFRYKSFNLTKIAHAPISLGSDSLEIEIDLQPQIQNITGDEENPYYVLSGYIEPIIYLGYYWNDSLFPYLAAHVSSNDLRVGWGSSNDRYSGMIDTFRDNSYNTTDLGVNIGAIKDLSTLNLELESKDDINIPTYANFKIYSTNVTDLEDNITSRKLVCQLNILNKNKEQLKDKNGDNVILLKIIKEVETSVDITKTSPLANSNFVFYSTPQSKSEWFNPTFKTSAEKYQIFGGSSGDPTSHHIVDYSPNRDSNERSNVNNLQVQDVYGTFKITSANKIKSGVGTEGCSETVNTDDNPCFVTAIDAHRTEGKGTAHLNLLGQEVAWNNQPGHRNLCYWGPVNFLYLPKGVSNPYSGDVIVTYPIDVKIEKTIKDTD